MPAPRIAFVMLLALSCSTFRRAPAGERPVFRAVISVDTITGTVTLPMHPGLVRERRVWYVVTESSDRADAARRGVTWAPRIAGLANGRASQYGQLADDGTLHYTAGVDFAPERLVRPAIDTGFPPVEARAGSVALDGYSPFVQLRNGVVINAPIIADRSGALDRVVAMDTVRGEVRLRMSRGYWNDRHAWYISSEASDAGVAALERATFAPALAQASSSSRSGILAIVNGVIERGSAERQGLQSALVNDLSPLNVLQHAPDPAFADSSYSPLWDLRVSTWTSSSISTNQREKVFAWEEGVSFTRRGLQRTVIPGVAINCPVIITFQRAAP